MTTTTAANGTVNSADAPQPGRSELAPMPRDPAGVVTELHDLLAAADVPGPYVLGGHSLGGALNVLYARTYADEVSALDLGTLFDEIEAAPPRADISIIVITRGEITMNEDPLPDGVDLTAADVETLNEAQ